MEPTCLHDVIDRMTDEELRQETVTLTFSNLAAESQRISKEHGFSDQTPGECIALMHSELSEALEEIRNGRPFDEVYYNESKPGKPEGVPVELADCVIRMLDFCARFNINLGAAILKKMKYNESRPFRHGGKKL